MTVERLLEKASPEAWWQWLTATEVGKHCGRKTRRQDRGVEDGPGGFSFSQWRNVNAEE